MAGVAQLVELWIVIPVVLFLNSLSNTAYSKGFQFPQKFQKIIVVMLW